MTKCELDDIIKRRNDGGETLSIERIDCEIYTKWEIKWAAKKYYGGWANARNEVVGVTKYAHKPDMTKDEVISELHRLEESGHSMKTSDFESWFYRRIVDHFGGYKRAKEELKIKSEVHGGRGERGANKSVDEVVSELLDAYPDIKYKKDYYDGFKHIADYSRTYLGCAYKIFEVAGLRKPANSPRKRRVREYSNEELREEIKGFFGTDKDISASGLSSGGRGDIVRAVERQYGSWNTGLEALGFEVVYSRRSEPWTKESVKKEVLYALSRGVPPYRNALSKEIKGLSPAVDELFGGISSLRKYCGICLIEEKPKEKVSRRYIPDLATEQGLAREITRLWYIGSPLNYSYIQKTRRHLLTVSINVVGSWEAAVTLAGISYDDVCLSTNVLSECGEEFENVFAEVLDELNYQYIREGEGVSEIIPDFVLKPDFILPNWRWLDCKLSEWTDSREMITRYLKERPNGLTVVYLRGVNRRKERGVKWKYEHISVYQFTKQMPRGKREYYENRLKEIEIRANSGDK